MSPGTDHAVTLEQGVAPLRALRETEDAREIFITTFTANLTFFSRAAAGRARSRGARVSVVSDLSQTTFDPASVRGVGIDWLDGRAWCRGAFHPKLIVIAHERSVTILVGSGNATPAGWVDSAELWLRVDADDAGAPTLIVDVADWLERFPDAVQTSHGVAASSQAAATMLRKLTPTHDGPRLVHNLDGAIIESLPRGPVDELIVSSPFHDPECRMLEELCERLRPSRLVVTVQESFNFEGSRLLDVAKRWKGQVVSIADDRYHHGKLVEWATPDGRFALIGSPNCTVAALGKSVSDAGGNCELAVICELGARTLLPASTGTDEMAPVEAHHYRKRTDGSTVLPMLVAALIDEGGTTLQLRIASIEELRLEVYDAGTWHKTGHLVPVGVQEFVIRGWWPERGQAMRLRDSTGVGTTPVAATQLSRLEHRTSARAQVGGSGDEFIDDLPALLALRHSLAQIRAHNVRGLSSGGGGASMARSSDSGDDLPGWMDRFERLRIESGERFTWFSLPHLARRSGYWQPHAGDPKPGAEPGDVEDPDAEAMDRAARQAAYRKRRIADLRQWCVRGLEPEPIDESEREARRDRRRGGLELVAQCTEVDICLAAIILSAGALDAWDDPDEEAALLTRAVQPLCRDLADDALGPDAASAAALALWRLDQLADDAQFPEVVQASLRGVSRQLGPLMDQLDDVSLGDRCASLATHVRPTPPGKDEVVELVLRLTSTDLLDGAEATLSREHTVERDGRTLTVYDHLAGNGMGRLLRLAAQIEEAFPFALRGEATGSGESVVVWDGMDLVLLYGGEQSRGELFHLPRGLGASLDPESGRPSARDRVTIWRGAAAPPVEALDVLRKCRP